MKEEKTIIQKVEKACYYLMAGLIFLMIIGSVNIK